MAPTAGSPQDMRNCIMPNTITKLATQAVRVKNDAMKGSTVCEAAFGSDASLGIVGGW